MVQITGEVVAPARIPNARNYAAGALNLKSQEEFEERNINFIAYDIQPVLVQHGQVLCNNFFSWDLQLFKMYKMEFILQTEKFIV